MCRLKEKEGMEEERVVFLFHFCRHPTHALLAQTKKDSKSFLARFPPLSALLPPYSETILSFGWIEGVETTDTSSIWGKGRDKT